VVEGRGNRGGNRSKACWAKARWTGAVSVAALATVLPASAMAQAADSPDAEVVVVTGIRAGIESSIGAKRDATSIVEVVSAEDIGKLPDVSIAESLARLPGLAGQRVNGRAQVISIRGLAPDFTTTLLNGRQQASSGDNRAVEFDQYPSELLSSVVVYKTPDATISGFGLSGTADLRTVRPLEFGRRAMALNARAEYVDGGQLNDDVGLYGGRFSASYIDQFANNTLGVAIGFAHLDSPSQNQHYKAYGYEAFGFAVTPDSADNALLLNGQEAFAYSRDNVRDAVIGIVEWAPNAQWHNTLDLYYSKFSQDEVMRGAQWFSNGWADNATFTNVTTEDRGGSLFGNSGTLNNAVPQLRNDHNTRDDELLAIGLNTEYAATDHLTLVADLSYSSNERDETFVETYAGYGVGVGGVTGSTPNIGRTFDTFTFDLPNDGYPSYTTGFDYADASKVSLGDRAPWGGWGHDGLVKSPHVEETIQSADFSARWDLDGAISGVDIGVNYTSREKSKFVDEYDLFLNGASRQQVLVGSQYLVSPTSLDFVGFGSVLAVNLPAALGVYYTQTPLLDSAHYDKAWEISEDVLTLYAKLSLDSGPLRGNFGVQAVQQEQESTGTIIQGSPVVPLSVTEGEDYLDWLPSINLSYELGAGQRVRFAAARVMARPRMDELRANITPGFSIPNSPSPSPGQTIHPWTGSGGNPHLEPWRADAFDLAYEWYIDRTSYFSVALFYKQLDNYIYNQSLQFDFTGVPIPAAQQPNVDSLPSGVIISNIGTMTLPANGEGGSVRGLEVSGAVDFGLFVDALEGFGLIANYSRSKSDLNPTENQNSEVRIPGLSGEVYGLTGYFERGGFQSRISYRYRSPFKGEVVQLFTNRGFTEILEDEQVDAQIGYTFEEGSALEGLGVLLQVNNLTNSPYRTRLGLDSGGTKTADGATLPETYEEYGRQILLGVNYRF